MITEHTILESAIERKNHYQGRMAENMANIIYFTKRKEKLEEAKEKLAVDSEERGEMNKLIVQTEGAIKNGEDNVEADQMLMDSFQDLIKKLSKKK